MRFGRLIRLCGLFGLTAAVALAQAPDAAKPGTTPSTYRSYIVADQRTDIKDVNNRTGKLHCLVDENSLNPVVAVFANKVPTGGDEPLAKLTKKLKELQATYRAEEFGAFVIFTVLEKDYINDEKADATAEAIKAWANTVQPGGVPLGLTKKPDGKAGDALSWGLPVEGTTVVLYHRHKVIKRWDLKDDGLTDAVVGEIAAAATGEVKKK